MVRWQIVLLVVLAAALAFVVAQNQAAFDQQFTLQIAGEPFTLRLLDLALALAAGWALMVLAGVLDANEARAEMAEVADRYRIALDRREAQVADTRAQAAAETRALERQVVDRQVALEQQRGWVGTVRQRIWTIERELQDLERQLDEIVRTPEAGA